MADRPDTPVASYVGAPVDLAAIRRVLLVRLRSIGDTVLMTPCISTIKRWRSDVEVDVLLEPFCAPLLESHPGVSRVVEVGRSLGSRLRCARTLRATGYDVAINLNGGTSASLLGFTSGARARVGFSGYQFPRLSNCRVTSSHDVWRRTSVHTVEHQLALVAGIGIPTTADEPTTLVPSDAARESVRRRLSSAGLEPGAYAVFHPDATFESKRWPADRFAALVPLLESRFGLRAVVIGIDTDLVGRAAGGKGVAMPDLTLAETMALLESAAVFVGNDSGPAHMAAALRRPVVVIFGPSNVELWRPWSTAPSRVVRGDTAAAVSVESVMDAVAQLGVEA